MIRAKMIIHHISEVSLRSAKLIETVRLLTLVLAVVSGVTGRALADTRPAHATVLARELASNCVVCFDNGQVRALVNTLVFVKDPGHL